MNEAWRVNERAHGSSSVLANFRRTGPGLEVPGPGPADSQLPQSRRLYNSGRLRRRPFMICGSLVFVPTSMRPTLAPLGTRCICVRRLVLQVSSHTRKLPKAVMVPFTQTVHALLAYEGEPTEW
jgi:hypothetical protein